MSPNPKPTALSTVDEILVVEDSRIVHAMIMKTLPGFTDSKLVQAHNGAQALNMIEKADYLYRLILLDLAMPILGGIDFMHHLRRMKNAKAGMPVIAVTGNQNNLSGNELRSVGLNGVVLKPITFHHIANILGQLPIPSRDHWFGMFR